MPYEFSHAARNQGSSARSSRFTSIKWAVPFFCMMLVVAAIAAPPETGSIAPDFTLNTPTGEPITLNSQMKARATVLVFLRGYPGYQCPYCQRQVHDFTEHAADFAAKQVNVVLVYPGPPGELDQRAQEFLAKQSTLPAGMTLVTDPDYKVTNLYGLRWDAPRETAYPSTFILNKDRKIMFQKISHAHGDRTTAEEILAKIGS